MRRRSSTRESGYTVVETLIAGGITLLLLGLCIGAWNVMTAAFLKTDRRTQLQGTLQVAAQALRREAQYASKESVSYNEDTTLSALAMLSARQPSELGDSVVLTPDALRLSWQKYSVFYLQKSVQQLFHREHPLAAGTPQERYPTPIEAFDRGGGPQDLFFYCEEGRRLGEGLDTFKAVWDKGLLTVTVSGVGMEPQSKAEERLSLKVALQPRN